MVVSTRRKTPRKRSPSPAKTRRSTRKSVATPKIRSRSKSPARTRGRVASTRNATKKKVEEEVPEESDSEHEESNQAEVEEKQDDQEEENSTAEEGVQETPTSKTTTEESITNSGNNIEQEVGSTASTIVSGFICFQWFVCAVAYLMKPETTLSFLVRTNIDKTSAFAIAGARWIGALCFQMFLSTLATVRAKSHVDQKRHLQYLMFCPLILGALALYTEDFWEQEALYAFLGIIFLDFVGMMYACYGSAD